MKSIANHFEAFARVMGLQRAGRAQRTDMRMAFYGGASVMLTLMTAIAAEGESNDVGVTRIEMLEAELAEFVRSLGSVAE